MTKNDLLHRLKAYISPSEENLLRASSSKLIISRYNLQTMIEILDAACLTERDTDVDSERVRSLHHLLENYLNRYMAEQPAGHKWIILASIYQAFVKAEPIHPMEVTHVRAEQVDGRIRYSCPCREDGADSICNFCICN